MPNDYIPRSDAEFNGWQANFVGYANANLAALGLVAVDLTPIITVQGSWGSSYGAHIAVQAAAQAARQTKDDSRALFEALIRALVRRLQASPSVNDPERQAMGITVSDQESSPIGAPATRPVATVDAGQRLRHTIKFSDENTPTRKAKPAGVMGAEFVRAATVRERSFRGLGPPPVDPGELTFLAVDTRTPYMTEFDGADGNKMAHYMLRWLNPKGQTGPWSQTVSATIGA